MAMRLPHATFVLFAAPGEDVSDRAVDADLRDPDAQCPVGHHGKWWR